MAQSELLSAVKDELTKLVPADWNIRTAMNICLLAEQITAAKQVIVIPLRTAWKRRAKGSAYREYTLGVVIVTQGGIETVDFDGIDNILNQWAMTFLTQPCFIENYPCMNAETLDDEIDFGIDERAAYITGLQFTFWSNQ
jgi:hypothetical protein